MEEDRIRLLMETTGCNRYEADLAVKSAGGNFLEALNFLHNAMARLEVIRGKFRISGKFIYGAFLFISDIKKGMPLAISAIAGNNPSIYEISISSDWEDMERHIYSARLAPGSMPAESATLQEKFSELLWILCAEPSFEIEERIKKTIAEVFESEDVQMIVERSEEPYKTPTQKETRGAASASYVDRDYIIGEDDSREGILSSITDEMTPARQTSRAIGITVEVEPLKFSETVSAKKGENRKAESPISSVGESNTRDFALASEIKPGDAIWVRISDTREVALYLAERLGAYKEDRGILPIVCEVISVRLDGNDGIVFEVKFAENVSGVCRISATERIKAVFASGRVERTKFSSIMSLWRKIFKKSVARRQL